MIVKREKTWLKWEGRFCRGKYLRTSWWLFGIIPLYISNKLIEER